jgi:long-chain acyl-CoA synthetase
MSTATPAPTASATATIAGIATAPKNPSATALRFHEAGAERTMTYAQLADEVDAYARGLLALGVAAGDRVGVLATTRHEWTIADLAILAAGAITVPIYQTNSPEECQYVIEHSGMKVLFCEDADQLTKIAEIRAQCPDLGQLIAFEGGGGEVLTLDELKSRGQDVTTESVRERQAAVTSDDIVTIVYTSGTTGPPKGCMLTHGNIRSDLDMALKRIPQDGHEVYFIFLPLAHVLTRVVQFMALDVGAQLVYWQRDPTKLLDEIAQVRPTHLPSVPRLFEKIYTAATSKVAEAGGVKEKLFTRSVAAGRRVVEAQRAGRPVTPAMRVRQRIADKLVLHKVRALFGDRIELCLTGAAPIEPDVMNFFWAARVPVLEGYGMTETSAVATLNTVGEHRLGTVGKPIPGMELKIAEDGEVLMKGPNIFVGYWNNEEATAKDLKDGWLHSGDLGEIDADGYLKITGRKKDIIITSSGKNIAPANVENAIRQHRWVSQAVVYGDRKPYLTAVITLDPDEAPALAELVGAPGATVEQLAEHPGARAEIQKVVDAANLRFARIEQVKKFAILPRDLSQEHNELTPTLKVKRNVVYAQHAGTFGGLYEG